MEMVAVPPRDSGQAPEPPREPLNVALAIRGMRVTGENGAPQLCLRLLSVPEHLRVDHCIAESYVAPLRFSAPGLGPFLLTQWIPSPPFPPDVLVCLGHVVDGCLATKMTDFCIEVKGVR
jgi:hypothetical protein